jgi:hypothetical protein
VPVLPSSGCTSSVRELGFACLVACCEVYSVKYEKIVNIHMNGILNSCYTGAR